MRVDYRSLSERLVSYLSSLTEGESFFGLELFNPKEGVCAVHLVQTPESGLFKNIVCYSNVVRTERIAYRSFLRKFLSNDSGRPSSVYRGNSKIWDERGGFAREFGGVASFEELDIRLAALGF